MPITGLLTELRVTAVVMSAGLWLADLGSSYGPRKGKARWIVTLCGRGQAGKGSIKEATGNFTDNTIIQTEGAAEKVEGKSQNTAGGATDVVRDAADK